MYIHKAYLRCKEKVEKKMEMKTIAIIYDSCSNLPAIKHNQYTLEEIFEGYVRTINYYFDELTEHTIIEGDAFLLSNETLLAPLRPYIPDFKKIILMKRSIQKEAMSLIMEIPKGADVLMVNDSFDSSVHTAHALYELGISHLNLIPYNPALESSDAYIHLQYALTPGEGHLVPAYIPNVIDFLYRVISFDTLLQLSEILCLTNDITFRNLIKHLNSIAERGSNSPASFLSSHLKTQIINLVVRDLPSAIFVVNTEFQPIYSNEQADRLLRSKDAANPTGEKIQTEMTELLKDIKSNTLIKLNEDRYMVEKDSLMFMDQLMGYCFTFHSENNIREMETNLSKQLRQDGLIARYHFQDMLHVSPVMEQTITIAKHAANTDHTVLIHGESGTGKELLAQSIHNYSRRKNYPFVAINCNTLPESLLESQLFGYEGGSFTGAQKNGKPGLFEQANHGTLFLDEIGDISPNLQAQLLRVLQERQVMRIGSGKVIDLDVRIIAASNQDLEALIQCGKFRSDLFYRLSVIPIEIPPLRDRQEDILPLTSVFLGDLYADLTTEQKESLCTYSWPGNIRQLENAAKYYETLHTLPSYLHSTGSVQNQIQTVAASNHRKHLQKEADCDTSQQLNDLIIALISASTEPFHGIGRSVILSSLKEHDIHMSDGKLRQLLTQFEAAGLITVAKGRGGCRITQKGEQYLKETSSGHSK